MKLQLPLILFCIAFLVTACPAGKDQDASTLNATWTITEAQLGGTPLPPQVAKTITLEMDAGKYEVKAENLDKGTYTIDEDANPKTLDITGVEGPNAGKHFPCIYELNGDVLKVCYQLGTGPRPTEFKSPAGTQIFLVTYQRKKD